MVKSYEPYDKTMQGKTIKQNKNLSSTNIIEKNLRLCYIKGMEKQMQTIKIPAKVNLSLEITGVKDGLHTLKMETVSIDMYDTVSYCPNDKGVVDVRFEDCFDGFDEDRFRPIIERAISKFVETYGNVGADMIISKRVPLGAGIGGSSVAVVGVVKALEKLKNTKVDTRFLLSIGSDIPVVYVGGRNLVTGVGDVVTPLEKQEKHFVILIKGAVDSGKAYSLFDKIGSEKYGARENHLEKSARILNEGVIDARKALENAGAKDVVMSGSGSAVVGVFEDENEAREIYAKIDGINKVLAKSV